MSLKYSNDLTSNQKFCARVKQFSDNQDRPAAVPEVCGGRHFFIWNLACLEHL